MGLRVKRRCRCHGLTHGVPLLLFNNNFVCVLTDLLILLACFADYAVRRHRDDPRFSLQHVVAGPRPGRVHHERTRVSSKSASARHSPRHEVPPGQ